MTETTFNDAEKQSRPEPVKKMIRPWGYVSGDGRITVYGENEQVEEVPALSLRDLRELAKNQPSGGWIEGDGRVFYFLKT